MYFNIAIFTIFTWYTFDDSDNRSKEVLQRVTSYISSGTIVVLSLMVIIFHVYRYGNTQVYSLAQNTKLGKVLGGEIFLDQNQNQDNRTSYSKILDAIGSPRNDGDYAPPILQLYQGPTSSDVSMTDCNESAPSESPLSQSVEKQQQDAQDSFRGGSTRNTKPKSFSCIPEVEEMSNKSIRKPLLEEDKV